MFKPVVACEFVQFIITGVFGILAGFKKRCLVCQHNNLYSPNKWHKYNKCNKKSKLN